MERLPLYAALFVTALTAALAVACIIARELGLTLDEVRRLTVESE